MRWFEQMLVGSTMSAALGNIWRASRQRTKQMRFLKGWNMGCYLCFLLGSIQLHRPIDSGMASLYALVCSYLFLNISGCIQENVLEVRRYVCACVFLDVQRHLYLAKTIVLKQQYSGAAVALWQSHSSLTASIV